MKRKTITPTKNKKTPKKKIFQGFYPKNAEITTERAMFDNQLVGRNPEGNSLNSGH